MIQKTDTSVADPHTVMINFKHATLACSHTVQRSWWSNYFTGAAVTESTYARHLLALL